MERQFPSGKTSDEWQVFLWNLPEEMLSRAQQLQLMLMIEGQFNAFDPFQVGTDLLRHRDLWDGVIMDRGFTLEDGPRITRWMSDLIKFRDISRVWHVDNPFI